MKSSEKQEPFICRIKFYHVIITYILSIIIGAALYYNFIDEFIVTAFYAGIIFALSILTLAMLIIFFIDSFND